jgi:hypothetical protein
LWVPEKVSKHPLTPQLQPKFTKKVHFYQFVSVRNWPLELSVHVLLKLLHVEDFEGLVGLEDAVGHLEDDVVRHRALLRHVPNTDGGGATQTLDLKLRKKKHFK